MADIQTLGSVAAVIVTFNRVALLTKVLESMASQERKPDGIIVINNASTDATVEVVNDICEQYPALNIELVTLSVNTGGAGGFFEGARKAFVDGYDAFWFMDDDTIPKPGALKYLESDLLNFEADTGFLPAFICSTVLWKNEDLCEMNIPRPIWDWSRFIHSSNNVALVDACSFVSVLVRREKVRMAGYPISDFFIWYDDVEFTNRLTRHGYPGLLSFRSQVNHLLPENKGVNYGMINESNAWKYRYGFRNEGAMILRDRGVLRFMHYSTVRLLQIFSLSIPYRVKLQMVKAAIDALSFKPTIRFPE